MTGNTPTTRERFLEVAGELIDLLEATERPDFTALRAMFPSWVTPKDVLLGCAKALALAVEVLDEEERELGRPS